MCVACEAGATTCPACRALGPASAFPFDERATLEQLVTVTWTAFQREWQACVLAGVTYAALILGGTVVTTVATAGASILLMKLVHDTFASMALMQAVALLRSLAMVPVQAVVFLGLSRMLLDVLMGRRPGAARFFADLRMLPRAMAVLAPLSLFPMVPTLVGLLLQPISPGLSSVVQVVGALVLLPLMLIFGLSLWLFSIPELLISDCSAFEAMRRAVSLSRGWKNLRLLGYAAIGGIGIFLGALACGVGLIAAVPLSTMLVLSLFLAVRNSSQLPAPTSL
jgi:hypothetical protein